MAVTNRVPDRDTEFQNGVILALPSLAINSPRNRRLKQCEYDESDPPVRAKYMQLHALGKVQRVRFDTNREVRTFYLSSVGVVPCEEQRFGI